MLSRPVWQTGLRRALLMAAVASGIAVVLFTAVDVFTPLGSTRALINIESACALALAGLSLLATAGTAASESANSRGIGWPAILLALVIIACFWRALSIGFLSDDFISVKYANTLNGDQLLAAFRQPSGGAFFRPLEYVSLRAIGLWAGFDPVRWHAANLVLHFMNSLLVYGVAASLYPGRWTPALAALLFAVHGTRPEAVVWVNGRLEVITEFFFLAALLLYLRYCEAPRASLLAGSLLCLLAAILTKESGYAFPLALLLIAAFRRQPAFRRLKTHLPFWFLTGAVFAYRWSVLRGFGGYPASQHLGFTGTLKALALRIWAALYFPVNWSAQPELWLALATGLYVISLMWLSKSSSDRSSLWFPLAFTLAASLPAVALLVIGSDLQGSRLLYLPSLGYCLWAALSIEAIRKPGVRWAAAVALLGFHMAALEHNLTVWQRVSAVADRTCASAAAQASDAGKLMVAGLPGAIQGVYFFANGFPECIEMRSRLPAGSVEITSPAQLGTRDPNIPALAWNPSLQILEKVK